MQARGEDNRFAAFFHQQAYTLIKNALYNYRLRRAAVSRYLGSQRPRAILEAGCGLSPVSNQFKRTVFMDLSFQAVATLRRLNGEGAYLVADCCHLPFKTGAFTHTISSEVLEHIPGDRAALFELARVTCPGGKVVVTFPHRQCYYSKDDSYVGHFRRYELREMRRLMQAAGVGVEKVEKVLGPLEKPIMLVAVSLYTLLQDKKSGADRPLSPAALYFLQLIFRSANTLLMGPVWLEARLLPVSFATVLMLVGRRNPLRVPSPGKR